MSDEQELLVATATRWARALRQDGLARAVLGGASSPIEELWPQMAAHGWLGITTPIGEGGSGGSLVDACLIVEILHQELIPAPIATNAVLVPAALRLFGWGDPTTVAELASGERRIGLGLSSSLCWPGSATSWEWIDGDDVLVHGIGGLRLLPGADYGRRDGCDLLRPLGRTRLPQEVTTPDDAATRQFTAVARTVASAALVGSMAGALRLAVDHATSREQFGQPIGAFQAVQHLCADILVDLEASRAACYAAASLVERGSAEEAHHAAAVALAWSAPASVRALHNAIQVLGGIGNTWESDLHLYLRGCHQWGRFMGGADEALDDVAAELLEDS